MLPWEFLLTGKFELAEFDPAVTRKTTVYMGKSPAEPVLNLLDNWEKYEYLPETV